MGIGLPSVLQVMISYRHNSSILLVDQLSSVAHLVITRYLLILKPATHLAILYADRRDRRKSPGVPGAAIAIFADRRDRRIKSPISGMSDIGD